LSKILHLLPNVLILDLTGSIFYLIFKVNGFHLTSIELQDNPKITTKEHRSCKYLCNYFYSLPLLLPGNSCIVNSFGDVLVRSLHAIVFEDLLCFLEAICNKYKYKIATIIDVHGTHATTVFDSYIK
jgi:hypothetical protein